MVRSTVAVLAFCAAALHAPAAHAGHAAFGCGPTQSTDDFRRSLMPSNDDAYWWFVYGYVVSTAPAEAVTIRCYVSVDGVEVYGTAVGTGTNVASTSGPLVFVADSAQDVEICAEWSAGQQSGVACSETTRVTQQQVDDAIGQAPAAADPVVCPALGDSGPADGEVTITPEGDVYVLDTFVWDCPPYRG